MQELGSIPEHAALRCQPSIEAASRLHPPSQNRIPHAPRQMVQSSFEQACGILIQCHDNQEISQGQILGMALQIQEQLILTCSYFKLNLPSNARIVYYPNPGLSLEGQNRGLEVLEWMFYGTFEQTQVGSEVWALGVLARSNPLQSYIGISKNYPLQYQDMANLITYDQQIIKDFQLASRKVRTPLMAKTLVKLQQTASYYVQYNLGCDDFQAEASKIQLLCGSPICLPTTEGLLLVGVHIGCSVKYDGGGYGLIFSSEAAATIQDCVSDFLKIKDKRSYHSELDFLKQVQNIRLSNKLAKYLFWRKRDKKVEIYFRGNQLKIRICDHLKHAIVYANLKEQQLNDQMCLVSDLQLFYRMVQFQLQNQLQDLDHVFSYRQGQLFVTLQDQPRLITVAVEAQYSILAVRLQQKQSIRRLQHRINGFIQDKINNTAQILRSHQERARLTFSHYQYKLDESLEKASRHIQNLLSKRIDKMIQELVQRVESRLIAHFEMKQIKGAKQEASLQIRNKLNELTQMLFKQKQDLRKLTLEICEVEKKSQFQFQELRRRMDSEEFCNQTNWIRFEEMHATYNSKLMQIDQQVAAIRRECCPAASFWVAETTIKDYDLSTVKLQGMDYWQKTGEAKSKEREVVD